MLRAVSRIAIALGAALSLGATPSLAASLPFTATLSIQIAVLAPITIAGTGTAVVNGSGGGAHLNTLALPAGIFATTGLVVPITDPAGAPIKGLQLTVGNSAGTVTAGAGAVPLLGSAKVCLFGSCGAAVANLDIPLSIVGNGGAAFVTGVANLTVIGAPWTTGTVAIGALTEMGFAYGPDSAASSTAQASGQIRLVTPIFVITNLAADNIIPAFASMTLHFVPEPATLTLLGGGVGLLAAAGRARLRLHEARARTEES